MKKLFITLLLACCGNILFAQSPTTAFDVDGIKVIFKPTVKEVINVRVFYRGGVTNYTQNNAGIEGFALEAAAQCGTKKYSGNAFRDKADKYDIGIGADTDYDFSNIQMECVSKFFNEGWDLLTEAVVNPVFEAAEVELLRNKALSALQQKQSDPDEHVTLLAVKNAFAGTPYAIDPQGDEGVVSKLTAADLRNYYTGILNKNQMFIVVAGKINKDELIARIKASFGALPARPYNPVALTAQAWADNRVITEDREISTNYINGIMNAPPVNSTDFVPYRLGMSAFGGLLFSQLRTKLNLSYDPGAYAVMRKMPYAIMYVSTTNPKEAVKVMTAALNHVKGITINADALKQIKSAYITSNYIKEQSTSALTESLGTAEVLGGWQLADALPTLINDVTTEQIAQAMNKYIVGLRWSYLGDKQHAAAAVDAFKAPVKN